MHLKSGSWYLLIISLSRSLSLYQYEHGDESLFWSVSHFSYVDLVAIWHGRGQHLWALTSQKDLPPCVHSSNKAGSLQALIRASVRSWLVAAAVSLKSDRKGKYGKKTRDIMKWTNPFIQPLIRALLSCGFCSVLFFPLICRIKVSFDQYYWAQCLVVKPWLIPLACQTL